MFEIQLKIAICGSPPKTLQILSLTLSPWSLYLTQRSYKALKGLIRPLRASEPSEDLQIFTPMAKSLAKIADGPPKEIMNSKDVKEIYIGIEADA